MKLTLEEFNQHYNHLLKVFASRSLEDMNAYVYRTQRVHSCRDNKMLWLMLFVFTSWTHQDGAYNYVTEDQLISMIERLYRIQ